MARKTKAAAPAEEPKPAPAAEEPKTNPGRPIWSGSIAFGLVNVPVSLYSLEQRSEVHFRLLDSRNHAKVRYERVNEMTGKEVPWDQIVKAYEYSDDNYVVMTDEDFAKVAVEATKTIEVEAFVPHEEIDPLFFDKPYILLPKKKAEKGYVLLREVMQRSGKVGIARVVIRTKEYLAALLPKDNALVVILLRFCHELRRITAFRAPEADPASYNVNDREILLAEQLVAAMSTTWEPEQYRDEYREALLAWIEEKAQSGGMMPVASVEEDRGVESTNVLDLATLLRQSMQGKGSPSESEPAPEKKKRTRKRQESA